MVNKTMEELRNVICTNCKLAKLFVVGSYTHDLLVKCDSCGGLTKIPLQNSPTPTKKIKPKPKLKSYCN